MTINLVVLLLITSIALILIVAIVSVVYQEKLEQRVKKLETIIKKYMGM